MPPQEQCPFCQLLDNPGQTFDVHESDSFKAWLDINPRARGHTMIVPREHVGGMEDIDGGELFDVVQAVAAKARTALGADGVSIAINDGEAAGQRLDHFYVQVFPRYAGEENEGAPAGAVFQPMEEVDEAQLEEWSSAMHDAEVGGAESIEGVAKQRFDERREGRDRDGADEEEEEGDTGRDGAEDSSWDEDEGYSYGEGAEFK
ncbi:MAG: HIT family protein [Candidatus Nanohaloarchaea archaeon]|nr:HIT family protein [Candidatus Nanohaloarchaea archaeon]